MQRREVERAWSMGSEDRKRREPLEFEVAESRTVFATTPIAQLEGRITPTNLYHILNQLGAPDLIHREEWALEVVGLGKTPLKRRLRGLKELRSRTVRAAAERAENDMLFVDYVHDSGLMRCKAESLEAR